MKALRRIAIAVTGGAALCRARLGRAGMGRPRLSAAGRLPLPGLDRGGRPRRPLLRAFATPDGRWRLEANLDEVDPQFVEMLIAYEDKRFWDHDGVDALALLRAAGQFAGNGRIVSGGSTLSMQLARLMEPRESRSLGAKLRQIAARHPDRAPAFQARDPGALPDAGALWRQSRRHSRGLAGLFRQGTETADTVGGRPARGTAAIARAPPAGPQPRSGACRARPRAASAWSPRA